MASLKDGHIIQKIKFANIDNDEFLLVFISNGDIFVLDKQSESFVTPDSHPSAAHVGHPKAFGKIPPFSIIDIVENLILAVSEKGNCTLHKVEVVSNNPKGTKSVTRSERVTKHVNITVLREFNLKKQAGRGNKQVISVSLLPKLGFFIVATKDGTVSFYSVMTCEFLACLN